MNDPRVILDTNVGVSAALLPSSVPRQAFDKAASSGTLLISTATIAELGEVLSRAKFDRYVSKEKRLEFLAALVREAEVVDVTEAIAECRDPADDKFLELGVSGAATHIITGDADLLELHPFRGIAIVTPLEFLKSARASEE
ncbi:MAG: putative toxin-antitoxin system toxin component, PIN family [Planctomycetes bacterium]|nr:putative toxin-antitoxin system toxin component, PIN family [Planctomycetota bacterium]